MSLHDPYHDPVILTRFHEVPSRFHEVPLTDQKIIKLPDEILVFGLRSGKFLFLDPCADLPFRVVMLWVSLFKCFHNGIRFKVHICYRSRTVVGLRMD